VLLSRPPRASGRPGRTGQRQSFCRPARRLLSTAESRDPLTRQVEVARLAATRLSTKQIAPMVLSRRTVESHLHRPRHHIVGYAARPPSRVGYAHGSRRPPASTLAAELNPVRRSVHRAGPSWLRSQCRSRPVARETRPRARTNRAGEPRYRQEHDGHTKHDRDHEVGDKPPRPQRAAGS
jgi:hypothetical protein